MSSIVVLSRQTRRFFSLGRCSPMPYKPEERPPLTDHQKRLYPQVEQTFTKEGYPILKIKPKENTVLHTRVKMLRRRSRYNYKAREESMDENQDWPSVWPTAKTFSPSGVPLPLRQSYEQKNPPRFKYANTELLKTPNFLHLTPGAIERQCKAIKKFCTDWPEGLDTDEEVRAHFPLTYITSDYIHALPTIRDVRSRIVTLCLNIKDLKLNPMDEDKLTRLLTEKRYDEQTGEIRITVSDCPTKIQNQDYADYLLTALYFESQNHEKWEEDKPECDWERFYWEKSKSKDKVKQYYGARNPEVKDEVIEKGIGDEVVENYRQSLEKLHGQENVETLESYRSSVERLFGFEGKKFASAK